MKVLLLGKNGLLGRELNSVFKESENTLYATGREELDITQKESVFELVNDIKPEVVINAAAFTNVDECETKKEFAMTVNGTANGYLAEICRESGAFLINFSTDYVFDGTKQEGYKEDDSPAPINVYGESKLLGEQLIQQNTNKYAIFRTSWLFGMHGRNFVKTMLDLSKDRDEISVVNDQIGKPTYTPDLARAVFDYTRNNLDQSGIFHLVNEDKTSWYHFAEKIFQIAQIEVQLTPISTEELGRPAKRPLISTLINNKLPLLRSHEEALKDYLTHLL